MSGYAEAETRSMVESHAARWRTWIAESLRPEFETLAQSRAIYQETMDVYNANDERLEEGAPYFLWIERMWALEAASAIRRLTDRGDQTESLVCLLREVELDPTIVSRDALKAAYGPSLETAADAVFTELVGPGESQVSAEIVRRHLAKLDEIGRANRIFTDKRLSHIDRDRHSHPLPKIGGLREQIDRITEIYLFYAALINMEPIRQPGELAADLPGDWRVVFRTPWGTGSPE